MVVSLCPLSKFLVHVCLLLLLLNPALANKNEDELNRARAQLESYQTSLRSLEAALLAPDFWSVHGPLVLVGLALFPRLTLLIATNVSATLNPLFWIAWFLFPRASCPLCCLTSLLRPARQHPCLLVLLAAELVSCHIFLPPSRDC